MDNFLKLLTLTSKELTYVVFLLILSTYILFIGFGFLFETHYLVLDELQVITKVVVFLQNIPKEIINILFFVCIIWLAVQLNEVFNWLKRQLEIGKFYSFLPKNWPDEWIFNGKPEVDNDVFIIKSCRAGVLLKKYWKNCEISFDLKFRKGISNVIGVIFRAQDLDNYFMIEIRGKEVSHNEKEANSLCPHIRYRSGWESLGYTSHNFDFNEWTKIRIRIFDEKMTFYYKDETHAMLEWILPTHVDVQHYEIGVKKPDDSYEQKNLSITSPANSADHVQKIPFRLESGMIGFRAHYGDQEGQIKNLRVKTI